MESVVPMCRSMCITIVHRCYVSCKHFLSATVLHHLIELASRDGAEQSSVLLRFKLAKLFVCIVFHLSNLSILANEVEICSAYIITLTMIFPDSPTAPRHTFFIHLSAHSLFNILLKDFQVRVIGSTDQGLPQSALPWCCATQLPSCNKFIRCS